MLQVFIPGRPVPQGSKRWLPNGHMKEANEALRPWRATVTSWVLKTMLEREVEKLEGPLIVSMSFAMKRPKGHYGTGKNEGTLKPSAPWYVKGVPDLDKLVRAVNDGITDAGLWNDDSQVVLLSADKHYAEKQGVRVTVAKVEEQ